MTVTAHISALLSIILCTHPKKKKSRTFTQGLGDLNAVRKEGSLSKDDLNWPPEKIARSLEIILVFGSRGGGEEQKKMRQSSAKSVFLVALFKSGFLLMGVPGFFFANWPHAVTLSLLFGSNRSSTAIKVVSYPQLSLSLKRYLQ